MLSRKSKLSLLCFLVVFGGSQLAGSIAWQQFYPELGDQEYGYRLAYLRAKRVHDPDRPLVLVLGSSRAAMGFSPRDLPPYHLVSGRSPLVYNFAAVGAGPLTELQMLRRLLANRIRPDWVFLEVWPLTFHKEMSADQALSRRCLHLVDLPLIFRYSDNPLEMLADNWPEVFFPCVGQRANLLRSFGPDWLAYEHARAPIPFEDVPVRTLDDAGWLPLAKLPSGEAQERARMQRVRQDYSAKVFADIQFRGANDRALRDLLRLCRKKGIATVLFTMPEASFFRGWYPPEVKQTFETYLAGLAREFGIPVIDTRTWVPDTYLADGFHLHRTGAQDFTRLFGRVALQPLLEGRK